MALFIRLEELRKCLLGVVCQAAQKLSTGSDEIERETQGIACPEIVVNKSLFYLATTTTSTTTAPFGNQMAQA
jgi:hypothetical protein